MQAAHHAVALADQMLVDEADERALDPGVVSIERAPQSLELKVGTVGVGGYDKRQQLKLRIPLLAHPLLDLRCDRLGQPRSLSQQVAVLEQQSVACLERLAPLSPACLAAVTQLLPDPLGEALVKGWPDLHRAGGAVDEEQVFFSTSPEYGDVWMMTQLLDQRVETLAVVAAKVVDHEADAGTDRA
jgi:hypothetical protein